MKSVPENQLVQAQLPLHSLAPQGKIHLSWNAANDVLNLRLLLLHDCMMVKFADN
jgi:hypothetical protein